ncbi:MAG TPA: hypothetical protein VGD06_09710 [Acidobacteriota bacterium]
MSVNESGRNGWIFGSVGIAVALVAGVAIGYGSAGGRAPGAAAMAGNDVARADGVAGMPLAAEAGEGDRAGIDAAASWSPAPVPTRSQPAETRYEPVVSRPQPAEASAEPRRDVPAQNGSHADRPAEPASTPPGQEPVDRYPAPAYEPAVERDPAPAPAEPRTIVVSVPAGTRISTRLDRPLSSADAEVGDTFSMSIGEAVWVDGVEVLPAGTRVWGYLSEVERARRPNKGGRLVLEADTVQLNGDVLALDAVVTADEERLEGRDSVKEDLKEVAIGAGLGGVVGGILGGKKGALIGILVGGGGTFAATKGEQVELPVDTPLYVELRRNLDVTFVEG